MEALFLSRGSQGPVSDKTEGTLQAVWPLTYIRGHQQLRQRWEITEICHNVHSGRSVLWQILKTINIVKITEEKHRTTIFSQCKMSQSQAWWRWKVIFSLTTLAMETKAFLTPNNVILGLWQKCSVMCQLQCTVLKVIWHVTAYLPHQIGCGKTPHRPQQTTARPNVEGLNETVTCQLL